MLKINLVKGAPVESGGEASEPAGAGSEVSETEEGQEPRADTGRGKRD